MGEEGEEGFSFLWAESPGGTCEVTNLVSFPLQPQPPPSNILQAQPLAGPHLGAPMLQPQPSGGPTLQPQPSGDLLLGEPVLQPTASQQQKVKNVWSAGRLGVGLSLA